jgi:hypothetical protein
MSTSTRHNKAGKVKREERRGEERRGEDDK